MFNTDIAIYNFLKKIAIKIIPAFGIELVGNPIGGWAFDITIIVILAFTALAKANKVSEKVKK